MNNVVAFPRLYHWTLCRDLGGLILRIECTRRTPPAGWSVVKRIPIH